MQRESAERQSAEGKCRKASADREPTTDANTVGGSDHVRISKLQSKSAPCLSEVVMLKRFGY